MPKNNQFGSIRSTMLTVGNIWLAISSEDFDAPFMSRVTEADHSYRSGAEAEIPSRRIDARAENLRVRFNRPDAISVATRAARGW
jgi:hypothetical protein